MALADLVTLIVIIITITIITSYSSHHHARQTFSLSLSHPFAVTRDPPPRKETLPLFKEDAAPPAPVRIPPTASHHLGEREGGAEGGVGRARPRRLLGRLRRVHAAEEVDGGGVDALAAQAALHALGVVGGEAEVVLDLLHGLAPGGVRDEHAAVRRVRGPALAAGDVPGVADHELEVVVFIDGGRDVGVVVLELAARDLPVHLAAHVEGVEELAENVVLRLLAREHVRVLRGVEGLHHLLRLDDAAAVLVEHVEGHVHEAAAARVEHAAHAREELVEVHAAAAVLVEVSEEHLHLLLAEPQVHLGHGLLELAELQALRAVVVHDAELPREPDDAARA
eukprot:CAMPEP_0118869644 /NCGR_PEP_ID=MMETSP1163-20130328/12899_1 /TAXON_ID=124430 /ORGANISM="Phaeomonas parva, Strain CCMP2877" /LENGTH=337 /DNA_ID=CAMNT_0006804559 /DNA_START=135 /DNA_END=1146 /DNA_ORIENTATION=+